MKKPLRLIQGYPANNFLEMDLGVKPEAPPEWWKKQSKKLKKE